MTAKNMLTPDWYKAWKGNAMYLPKSQGKAIEQMQQKWCPLQAMISVTTGSLAADPAAFKKWTESFAKGEWFVCESCNKKLTGNGIGHAKECRFVALAKEILTSEEVMAKKRLERQNAMLSAKLEETNQKLAKLNNEA